MNEKELAQLERMVRRRGPCRRRIDQWWDSGTPSPTGYVFKISSRVETLSAGAFVEDTTELLATATAGLKEAGALLARTSEDIRTLADTAIPLLMADVQKLRDLRMTVTREAAAVVGAYEGIRPLLKESDRIERFVSVMRELATIAQDPAVRAYFARGTDASA